MSAAAYDARRVMYSSLDREGHPVAVTGLVIAPRAPWVGLSKRPVISYAAGTQGLADRCAPSRQTAQLSEYELLFMSQLLARGYTVVMTDYQGLGTPGTHTYMNREAQGHAVLDIVRAAQALGLRDTTTASPVGLQGYSQGGGAAAAAAELAGSYAPALRMKGAAVGAVPADLAATLTKIDGSTWAAFMLYGTAGLMASHHIEPSKVLSPTGVARLADAENSCVFDFARFSGLKSSTLTNDARPLSAWLADPVLATAVEENRIGRIRPSMPVLVSHSTLDDTIPYSVGKQLQRDWCAKGADVQFRPNLGAAHIGGMIPFTADALGWWEARFAGLPQISTCGVY